MLHTIQRTVLLISSRSIDQSKHKEVHWYIFTNIFQPNLRRMYLPWFKNGIFLLVGSFVVDSCSVLWKSLLVESYFLSNFQCSSSNTFNPKTRAPTLFARFPSTAILRSTKVNGGDDIDDDDVSTVSVESERRNIYLQSLYQNLQSILDEWIISGSKVKQQSAYNILEQIQQHEQSNQSANKDVDSYHARAQRLIQRAGLPLPKTTDTAHQSQPNVVFGSANGEQRRDEALLRREWETQLQDSETLLKSKEVLSTSDNPLPREKAFIKDKFSLQQELNDPQSNGTQASQNEVVEDELIQDASNRVSAMVARAGANASFTGQQLEIGGLDDVLSQIKRRIWTPLAAPPQLLQELGIAPVRGLLLYGKPGCGKTLLARKIGQILSPIRPITVVSGPEIMDKFVGSSERKLRDIFDNPPNVYESVRMQEADMGVAISKAALHVIVMDEFDAIARHRGGRDRSGDQGDAGVARDSVVNQLLAKMDGVAPLVVPTLVIGLTNKRSLIDSALLRSGRFEVQIEVPPPVTIDQRVSILRVHTQHMQQAGRLLISDAPIGSAAASLISKMGESSKTLLPTYNDLLLKLAEETEGFSGASLAAVARAAASHALERAVSAFVHDNGNSSLLQNCIVTLDDFEEAKKDFENLDESDFGTTATSNSSDSLVIESPLAKSP
jgi:ATP-dependent 26S proteasome regulatory subunit